MSIQRMSKKEEIPGCFSLCGGYFRFCPIQNFLEFCNPMSHSRVHVCFGTFDVVMEIVAEELDVGDRARRNGRLCEMAREEYESYISNVFSVAEAWYVANFERRFTRGVEDLRRVLDCWLSSRVHKFLTVCKAHICQNRANKRTCKNTFPKIRSVSSRKTVEKMTVTRSGEACTYIASSSR